MMRAAVLRLCGHCDTGPRGVLLHGKALIRSPISPPPARKPCSGAQVVAEGEGGIMGNIAAVRPASFDPMREKSESRLVIGSGAILSQSLILVRNARSE